MKSVGKLPKICDLVADSVSSSLLNSSSAILRRGAAPRAAGRGSASRPSWRQRRCARRRARPRPGGSCLPPSISMISWPNWRRRMPPRASSGSAAIRPKTLRLAGSAVPAEQQVGRAQVEEAQRVRLDDLAEVHQPAQLLGRRRDAHGQDCVAGLGRGQQVADRADAADARGDARPSPQNGRPSQNFSKPRNSTTWNRASATWPASSR